MCAWGAVTAGLWSCPLSRRKNLGDKAGRNLQSDAKVTSGCLLNIYYQSVMGHVQLVWHSDYEL